MKEAYSDLPSFEKTTMKGNLLSYTVRGKYDPDSPKETVLGWGPWKMKRHGQREMIFEKYEDHPVADEINFPEVKWVEYTTNQARYQAMLSDEFSGIDLVVTQTVWDQLGDFYDRYVFKRRLGVGWAFNYKRFPDHRVRQAIAYAINKPQVVANSGLAEDLVTPHEYDTGLFDKPDAESRHAQYYGDDFLDKVTRYDQDTDEAASLLQEVGWQKDDGQWYDDDDEKVQITIRTPPTWTEWVNMAQTTVQHLNDFGIDAEFETQELVVYYGQTMVQVDYDMAAWWCGGARPYPWFAYNTAWNALQTIADDNNHPDEYENVPSKIGDPNSDPKSVNWQEKLNTLANVRVDSEEHKQLSRELGWTYNQMLPVYCMNENKGLGILNRNKWHSPGEGSEASKVFFPLTHMNSNGQIKSLGR
jgi:peptide/nickel transport system substrate-binding protein